MSIIRRLLGTVRLPTRSALLSAALLAVMQAQPAPPRNDVAQTVVSGIQANVVDLTAAPAASFILSGVVNAASFQTAISPGSLVSIFGQGLASGEVSADRIPLPTTMAGATVRMNNILAPLLYVGPSQINCQIPVDIKPGAVTVTVQNGSQSSSTTVTVVATSPGLFSDSAGHGVIQNQDYSLNASQHPAKAGEVIILYGTGLGPTNPGLVSGASSPPGPNFAKPTGNVSVSIGGVGAEVRFAAAIPGFVALFQLNVAVPSTVASGELDVVLSVAGVAAKAAKVSIVNSTGPTRSVTLHLINNLVYPVDFSANGAAVARVDALTSTDKTISAGSSLVVNYNMIQPTLGGRQLGDPINATYDPVNNPTGTLTFAATPKLANATYFAPRVNNQTPTDLLLGVNVGLTSENRCNCTAPANTSNVQLGYYRYFSNSNVRAYLAGSNYSGSYIYFGQDPSNPSGAIAGVDSVTGTVQLTITKAPTGATGGGSSTGEPPTATYFMDYTGTLPAAGSYYTQGFTISRQTTLIFRFTSDFVAQAAVMDANQLTAFQGNQAFTGRAVFDQKYGTQSVTLAAGSYAIGVRNFAQGANSVRYELDYDVSIPGLNRIDSNTYTFSVAANGGRYYQGFSIQQGLRYWVDGCNTGVDVFLISESELPNFLNGATFNQYSDYGGTGSPDLPGGYEVKLNPGNYYYVFRNPASVAKAVTFSIERWR